jgi:hypothetical protein
MATVAHYFNLEYYNTFNITLVIISTLIKADKSLMFHFLNILIKGDNYDVSTLNSHMMSLFTPFILTYSERILAGVMI